ncbi:class I SAM-dependent methyltransferase [Sphingobacterium sp. UT-1RO-CII-1]|uniref:O-methyltransferase n=1 Tax=Sphingobacterium sp. UT-1RO-CII-1 TaxID=2995225 RepID=UPI00227AEDA1|nr:class I SAM-dependent methyltransferase [Sphingobacterium sp. UT-1RO-CII-1]MCY4778747.1 class I SAM-dependent methyltransferase [Sphingobacterium sp. UT-1RO-CII-1]
MLENEKAMEAYLEQVCGPENELLKRINRETYLRETMPHMLSGHFQGRVLAMLSKLISPKRILEIGTFTGYATLCLAEGLVSDGIIYTIDINEEQEERVRGYFNDSVFSNKIKYLIGDAIDVIEMIEGDFDMVFIDADKKRNLYYFETLINRVPSGGLILIDNVLWKGKVVSGSVDKQTQQVIDLNKTLAEDKRVEKLILPIRDGLFVLRKK